MKILEQVIVDKFLIGSIWQNSNGYKVKILDYGYNDVWLLYDENKNKCSWAINNFTKQYYPIILNNANEELK